jgi:predicted ATPase/DNA-binding XRE family transcriptional regulator/Tfp pilus assembly protein PilF
MGNALTFGRWLKQRRKALGLTQDTLARRVGCATITIQKLEAGALRPSAQIAERLADHLNLAADDRVGFLATARTTDLPLPTSLSQRSVLPVPTTPLIGRGPIVTATCAMLQRADVRLVTLLGPPGVGKTRLALQVAHELQPTLRDGAVFVSLAPIRDPDLVLASIAQALNLPEAAHLSFLKRLQAALHTSQRFLVLDNFEQLLAAAPAISELLEAAPALKVLVTSRAALHLSGEHQVLVPPLALPDLHNLPPLDALAQVPAVALFVQRAQAVAPGFTLTETNAADVAAICQRLDGLPLALELAAARSKLFPPHTLLAHLQSPLAVLTVGARNLPAHQQTLRSTIAWSYDLLPAAEQALFARLGVFVGGFTFEAVSAICSDTRDSSFRVLDGLALLLNQSLVQHELSAAGEVRLSMLETIREYALEQLAQRQEADSLRERHACYYVQLAEQAEEELHGPQQVSWYDRLEHEHENIRAALAWSLQHDMPEIGLRLVGALYWFWSTYGHVREGYHWSNALLPYIDTAPPAVQARALYGAGLLAWYRGQHDQSVALTTQSAALSRSTGNARVTTMAWALLAILVAYRGEHEQAAEWNRKSIALMSEAGDRWGLGAALGSQGISAFNLQRFEQAETYLTESLAINRELGDIWVVMYVNTYLGLTLVHQGKHQQAEQALMDGLRLLPIVGMRSSTPEALVGLAATAFAQGQIERAIQLSAAAEALREVLGTFLSPVVQSIRENCLTRARGRLDELTFTQAWEAGRAMSLKQAIEFALGDHAIT